MQHVVIVGAGIVGISAGLWLRRMTEARVTVIDRLGPGEGTSHGNAGVLAACGMVPVTVPGLVGKAPGMLADRESAVFLRWAYLPRLLPWLVRYLSHAADGQTRRIAGGLAPIVTDTVAQHRALAAGTPAERYLVPCDYVHAYPGRAAWRADAYGWALRREAGFEPELIEGEAVQEYDPALDRALRLIAVLRDHGHVRDPGGYVRALAEAFRGMGGEVRRTELKDIRLEAGRIAAVETADGAIPCDRAVIATGAWSAPWMKKLGIAVPLETERGYHIVFEGAEGGPAQPTMISTGKFVATPMEGGLRCAGLLEFGGLAAGPSAGPLALIRRQVTRAFPRLTWRSEVEWLGHRPATTDSLPLIGEAGQSGVFAAFGHHHVGLTGGPKTGRLVAGLVSGQPPNLDLAPYAPGRFA